MSRQLEFLFQRQVMEVCQDLDVHRPAAGEGLAFDFGWTAVPPLLSAWPPIVAGLAPTDVLLAAPHEPVSPALTPRP